jgi:hypothetical protein
MANKNFVLLAMGLGIAGVIIGAISILLRITNIANP